jgi:hypothetical protein
MSGVKTRYGGDRLLPAGDISLKLPVDVVDESLPDVLQARLLDIATHIWPSKATATSNGLRGLGDLYAVELAAVNTGVAFT